MKFTLSEIIRGKTHEGKGIEQDLRCHLFAQAFLPYVLNSIVDSETRYKVSYISMGQIQKLPSLDGIIFDTRGCVVYLTPGTKMSEIRRAFI